MHAKLFLWFDNLNTRIRTKAHLDNLLILDYFAFSLPMPYTSSHVITATERASFVANRLYVPLKPHALEIHAVLRGCCCVHT